MITQSCTSIFPIQHKAIWEAYKTHVQAFWVPSEVSLADDITHWNKLNDNERHFITHVLAFFANSEAMINENLASRFYQEILIPEARAFIAMQMLNETIHAEMYALQIEAYAKEQKTRLFDAIKNVPCIAKKASWVAKWLQGDQSLLLRLIGFGLVEGLFFAGSFCAIYYFRQRGLLPGLAVSNDWIARDEGMHFSFSALMFKTLSKDKSPGLTTCQELPPVTEQMFSDIVREAVACEHEFVRDALPVGLLGMNADLMCQYIEAVADRIADIFGFPHVYNTANPFDFMRMLDVEGVTNFFERQPTEYQKPTDRTLAFDVDF